MDYEKRESVKEHYGNVAANMERDIENNTDNPLENTLYDQEYLENLPKEAVAASLGCANPLVFAGLKEGETVLDLGSGGGIDVLVSSKIVGPSGKIYGLDMTDEMLTLANRNKERMGVTNVEFIKGYIEDIPLPDESVDVIISNCVINLSTDKEKALSEAYRVLKKGGRLAVADMVTLRGIPENIRQKVYMWSSCLAGTLKVEEYQSVLDKAGFREVEIQPVHIYNQEFIEALMDEHPELDTPENRRDIPLVAGAYAGAYVKAGK